VSCLGVVHVLAASAALPGIGRLYAGALRSRRERPAAYLPRKRRSMGFARQGLGPRDGAHPSSDDFTFLVLRVGPGEHSLEGVV